MLPTVAKCVTSAALLMQLWNCRSPSEPHGTLIDAWFQAAPQQPFDFMWSKPEVLGDTVVFGSPGSVTARDFKTGAPRWNTPLCERGGPQARNFAVADGVVLVGCGRAVVALNRDAGSVRWRYQPPVDAGYDSLPGVIAGNHLATDGSAFYVPAWGASVSALSVSTGAPLWVWRLGRLPTDTAATVFRSGAIGAVVSGDTVFVTAWHWTSASHAGVEVLVIALHRLSGQELWKTTLPSPRGGTDIATNPLVTRNLVLALTEDGYLYALNRASGQIAWQYRSPAFAYSTLGTPSIADDVIYATLGDEHVTALRAADGAVQWSVPAQEATTDITTTSDRIYIVTYGLLTVYDRTTGARVASGRTRTDGATITTAVAAADNQVFLTTSDGAWSVKAP